MINVDIINEQDNREIKEEEYKLITDVLTEAARIEGIENGEVAVILVDDSAIHDLNRDYRGIDRPTDVLSFAMNESAEDEMTILYDDEIGDIPNVLGDIIISIPRAMEQANEYSHSFDRELGFLTVHGFLHLLGYDHQEEKEEKDMFDKQELVLKQLKIFR